MEKRTFYLSKDGYQFDLAEDCQRYEILLTAVRQLQEFKDNCELPEPLAKNPIVVDRLLLVLGDFRANSVSRHYRAQDPLDLARAVDTLIDLADYFRKV